MRGHPEDLTKAVRVAAYKVVDEILGKPLSAVAVRHNTEDLSEDDRALVIERATHILSNLRDDAENLWKEG